MPSGASLFPAPEITLKGHLLPASVSLMECSGVHSSGVSFADPTGIKIVGVRTEPTKQRRGRAEQGRYTDDTMGSTIPILLVLFLMGQLQGRTKAHPIDGSELADFKALLERLEDKLQPGEMDTGLGHGFDEPNDETAEEASETVTSWEDEYARPQSEGGFSHGSRQPTERLPAAPRNKLRSFFNAPRNLQKFSNCFGQRLDRIGTASGMGCIKRKN